MKKEDEQKILLYATYTILYLNDTACNCVKDLIDIVKSKDKESQKIYGALTKRALGYFRNINDIIGDKIDFFADFCSEMDDICDQLLVDFKNSIRDAYMRCSLEDSDYYAKVETMRSMVGLAMFASNKIINTAKDKISDISFLKNYVMTDMSKIADNFSNWAYRNVPKNLNVNFNEESEVMVIFRELSQKMVDFESFDKAYRRASDYEKERNYKNK